MGILSWDCTANLWTYQWITVDLLGNECGSFVIGQSLVFYRKAGAGVVQVHRAADTACLTAILWDLMKSKAWQLWTLRRQRPSKWIRRLRLRSATLHTWVSTQTMVCSFKSNKAGNYAFNLWLRCWATDRLRKGPVWATCFMWVCSALEANNGTFRPTSVSDASEVYSVFEKLCADNGMNEWVQRK